MKVNRFVPPYFDNGRTRFRNTLKKSGVYLIKEDNKLVYVGFSGTNLYKTLYRHFEEWNHPGQPVVTYAGSRKKYTVRVVLCTKLQATRLEKALIIKNRPRDNENKYLNYELDYQDKQVYDTYLDTDVVPF